MNSKTNINEILKRSMVGKRLTPSQYPTFAGTVADVYQNQSGDESWVQIKFTEPEAGVGGYYSLHDFDEEFELSESE